MSAQTRSADAVRIWVDVIERANEGGAFDDVWEDTDEVELRIASLLGWEDDPLAVAAARGVRAFVEADLGRSVGPSAKPRAWPYGAQKQDDALTV